jgi:hypothetical protein
VHGIFGGENILKDGHPFAAIDGYDKWVFDGLKKGFWDQVEDAVKALEASLSRKMGGHLVQKNNAHSRFLTLLTDSVQHILRLHRTMDVHFLRYRTIFGDVLP